MEGGDDLLLTIHAKKDQKTHELRESRRDTGTTDTHAQKEHEERIPDDI